MLLNIETSLVARPVDLAAVAPHGPELIRIPLIEVFCLTVIHIEHSLIGKLQPVRVNTGFEEEGVLVFDDEQRLVAVLVHLSDRHEVAPGQWFLEAGFGPLDDVSHPAFADLEEAQDWISRRLADPARVSPAAP
jgi:hypothetical protein